MKIKREAAVILAQTRKLDLSLCMSWSAPSGKKILYSLHVNTTRFIYAVIVVSAVIFVKYPIKALSLLSSLLLSIRMMKKQRSKVNVRFAEGWRLKEALRVDTALNCESEPVLDLLLLTLNPSHPRRMLSPADPLPTPNATASSGSNLK